MEHDTNNVFETNRQRNAELGDIKKVRDAQRDNDRDTFIDLLLSNQCPSQVMELNGINIFQFPLHCDGKVEVFATKEEGKWVVVMSYHSGEEQ